MSEAVPVLYSPADLAGWRSRREHGLEVFTAPDGRTWTRAIAGEPPALAVCYTKVRGLPLLLLADVEQSYAIKGARRRARKAERELEKRGYEV